MGTVIPNPYNGRHKFGYAVCKGGGSTLCLREVPIYAKQGWNTFFFTENSHTSKRGKAETGNR